MVKLQKGQKKENQPICCNLQHYKQNFWKKKPERIFFFLGKNLREKKKNIYMYYVLCFQLFSLALLFDQ